MDLALKRNTDTLLRELNWLKQLIKQRMNSFFNTETPFNYPLSPNLKNDNSIYASCVKDNELEDIDRVLIALSIASVTKPSLLDYFYLKNKTTDKPYSEFGGMVDSAFAKFKPTILTGMFLCYGDSLESCLLYIKDFMSSNALKQKGILDIASSIECSLLSSQPLKLSDEYYELIINASPYAPKFNSSFPANSITTNLNWNDLVLNEKIMDEIDHISTWISNSEEIKNHKALSKQINTGYKCLFYGAPGTGKSLTASLLGKKHQTPVYRVDLSQLVSKYIGETEKNLSNLFDKAEKRNWILFFDEAESLFSKRTGVKDSKDKHANQQTGYLLQRIENYDGLIILATNLKPNIDQAFSRRIQSQVRFQLPDKHERTQLWKKALKNIANISDDFITLIANDYELSGGSIKNIIQYVWLLSKRKNIPINDNFILAGIKRELNKEGKSFDSNK